ncbi:MAG: helix-turn-helix domain-containing protein, partial [Xanthomonadaceae bacterium]|nr:helix-turn-helix domain-containing protein [Xanthomonadaceae bacterium]
MRRSCLLTRRAAADWLGVSLRTVHYWEAGRCRVPWPVVRLLRLLRQGDLGTLAPAWTGWTLHGSLLRSPEGRTFAASDL